MVTTEAVEPAVEPDRPHRHRPLTWSEPYSECGVWWTVPVCECGLALPARRVSRKTA